MEIKKGIGVSPGVVISTAVVLDAEDVLVPKRQVDAAHVPQELQRFSEGVARATTELKTLRDEVATTHGKEIGGIFEFHIGLLKDKTLLKQFEAEIKNNHATAEYAVSTVIQKAVSGPNRAESARSSTISASTAGAAAATARNGVTEDSASSATGSASTAPSRTWRLTPAPAGPARRAPRPPPRVPARTSR